MCIFGLSVNKNPVEKTPQTLDCGEDTSFQSGGIIRLEIKCTVIVLHLNHPKTTPYSLVYEKLSSTKPVSGAEKVGDFCYRCSFRYKGKYCLKCLATLKQSVSSVTQSYPTLWDPMNRSTPGHPVHHLLLKFTRSHVLWVGDAIQPSHPLSSPSPPALNLSQHQGLFQWVSSLHQVAKVLEFQLQYQSFQWTPRTDILQDGLVGSPCSPRDSQESSPTPQSKSINSSAFSFLYSPTLTSIHDHWKNHNLDQVDLCWQSNVSAF